MSDVYCARKNLKPAYGCSLGPLLPCPQLPPSRKLPSSRGAGALPLVANQLELSSPPFISREERSPGVSFHSRKIHGAAASLRAHQNELFGPEFVFNRRFFITRWDQRQTRAKLAPDKSQDPRLGLPRRHAQQRPRELIRPTICQASSNLHETIETVRVGRTVPSTPTESVKPLERGCGRKGGALLVAPFAWEPMAMYLLA